MSSLSDFRCVPCRGGEPVLTDDEIAGFLPQVSQWAVIEVDGIHRLERVFKVKDFVKALDFTNRVGTLAEEEGHHPALLSEWGRVTVTWWTHKIRGLHRNDFSMAAKTEQLYPPAAS